MADDISLIVGVDYSELTGLVKTTGQTKRALGSMAKEFANSGSQKNYMAGINKLVAAQKNLDKSARMSRSEIMKLGNQMKQEVQFTNALAGATKNLGAGLNQTKRSTNQLGVMMQQTGYQVGDFAVQVQSGTNFMVAFGQQATQLVGTMAMFAKTTKMIALFSGLGIAIPIISGIAAAMMRTSGSSKTLSDNVSDLETSTDNLLTSFDNLNANKIAGTFGGLAFEVARVESAMVSLETTGAMINLSTTLEKLESQTKAGVFSQIAQGALNLSRIIDPFDMAGSGSGSFGQMLPEDVDEEKFKKLGLDMSSAVFDGYVTNLQTLAAQGDQEGVVSAFADMFEDASDGADDITLSGLELLRTLRSVVLATAEMTAEMDGSAAAARDAEKAAKELAKEERKQTLAKKAYADLVAKTRRDQEGQISILQAQLKHGKDSLEVAKLRTKLEGEAKGFAGDALEIYIQQQLKIGELEDDLDSAYSSAKNIAGIDFSNIADGATWAGSLADQLRIARGVALDKAAGGNVDFFDPRGRDVGSSGAGRLLEERGVPKENRPGYVPPKKRKGGDGSKKDLLADLQKQLNLEQQLVGKSEEYVRVRQALGDTYDKVEPKTISNLEKQIVLIREATEAENQRQQLMSSVENSLEQGFMSMIDGTKSVKEAFKDMAREIIKELYRVLVVKKMVSTITSFLPFADGGVFSGGSQVQAFANGGVVGGPTMFPMSGGKTGLMGEAGPEAIMPLKRGANGKLGVQMEGGGSVTVVNNFNVAANGDDSVKRIVQQQIPRIAEATKAAVVDSKRRGGSYGRAFG